MKMCFMQQILNLPLDISVATCITCIYMEIINVLYFKIFVKVKNSRFKKNTLSQYVYFSMNVFLITFGIYLL